MRLSTLIIFLSFVACSASNSNVATKGDPKKEKETEPVMGGPTHLKITILQEPTLSGTAKLVGFYSDQNYIADTVNFQNGTIQFNNEKGLPQGLYYLIMSFKKEQVQIILGEDQEFEVEVDLKDILNTFKSTGDIENQLMYENFRFENDLLPKIKAMDNKLKTATAGTEEYKTTQKERDELELKRLKGIADLQKNHPKSLYASYKNAGQNPKVNSALSRDLQVVQFRKEFWDNVNFDDRRLLRTPVITNKLKKYMKELTPQNPDSLFNSAKMVIDKMVDKPEYFKVFTNWVVLTYEPGKCDLMDAEALFVSMVQKYFTKEKAFWQDTLTTQVIQQRAQEMSQSLIGKQAPNVISTDPNGAKKEIYKMTSDYIIVYMFNPDCEHCQEQTPKLAEYYHQNKATVDVFAIAVDTDADKWKAYINKNNLDWTNVYDPTNRSIYGKYFVDHTPELYVLNKERKIIGKNLKVNQIQLIIDRDKEKQGLKK